jgi:hypothetical protein
MKIIKVKINNLKIYYIVLSYHIIFLFILLNLLNKMTDIFKNDYIFENTLILFLLNIY